MCPPVLALASLAVTAATSFAGYKAQQAQYESQKEQKVANDRNALASARNDQNQLTLRTLQEQEAYGQKAHLQKVEEAERTADIRVSAAGSGVAGISVGNLVSDARRRAGNNLTTLETNYQNTAAQLEAEQRGTVDKANARIASVANPTKPSPAGALIGFAGAAIDKAPTIFKL